MSGGLPTRALSSGGTRSEAKGREQGRGEGGGAANQTLCQVNDSVARVGVFVGVFEGGFHWHRHDREAELFYVINGKLLLDLEARTVELAPRQCIIVPRRMPHRSRAPERAVVLMVEAAGVVPTGDQQHGGACRVPGGPIRCKPRPPSIPSIP